jgi:ankyrin repeat protein
LTLSLLAVACGKTGSPDDPILSEIDAGNVEAVSRLLASGVSVNTRNSKGLTPLMAAAFVGSTPMVQLLIARGADVGARYQSGDTALHFAAIKGKRNTVELLIASGADVNARNAGQYTPLGVVVLTGAANGAANLGLLETLTARAVIGLTSTERLETSRLLLDHGARIDAVQLYGAATYGDAALAKLLIDHGAKLDDLTGGETPLHSAIAEKHIDVAELLVNRGANVNVRNVSARTPLHFLATFVDEQNLAELMIKHRAEINPRDKNGMTPLAFAINNGRAHVAEALQRHGATR